MTTCNQQSEFITTAEAIARFEASGESVDAYHNLRQQCQSPAEVELLRILQKGYPLSKVRAKEKAVKTLAKALKNSATGIYDPCDPAEATHVRLCFPGPFCNRMLPVNDNAGHGWKWNRSETNPTLTPSIRTTDGTIVCHSFVIDGMVHFCGDSTHEFAGKTLPLEEIN